MENNIIIEELKPREMIEEGFVCPPDNWEMMNKINEIINYINKKNIEKNGK